MSKFRGSINMLSVCMRCLVRKVSINPLIKWRGWWMEYKYRRYFNKSKNEIFCTSKCFLKIKSLAIQPQWGDVREEKKLEERMMR
jgi:hypothetical protein